MNQKKQIWIVGMGSGSLRCLTRQASAAIQAASVLIGSEKVLSLIENDRNHPKLYASGTEEVRRAVAGIDAGKIAVLVPWDAMQGYGAAVYEALLPMKPAVIPGVTQQAYLMSRTGVSAEDAAVLLEARETRTLSMLLKEHEKVFFSGGRIMRENLPRLLRAGYGELQVCYVENPGDRDEYAFRGKLENLKGRAFADRSLFLLHQTGPVGMSRTGSRYEAPGEGRYAFPEEIRVLTLHAMKISRKAVIYDVGAGDCSIALDAAQMASDGYVYAVEKDETLTKEGKKKLAESGVGNLQIITGTAPAALGHLPAPDIVLIEGTDGSIKELLQIVISRNPFVRAVCLRGTVEGASEAVRLMEGMHFSPVMTEISCVRTMKTDGRHRLQPHTPYYLISGDHRVRGSGK